MHGDDQNNFSENWFR